MRKIRWEKTLSLGVPEIDEQHKELIRIANLLLFAIEKDRSEDAITEILTRLREYTVFHFTSEEEYMERIGYPKRGEHMQEHKILKQKVKNFQYSRFQKETVALEELRDLLSGWLLTHIMESDLEIARYLQNQKD